MRQKRRTHSAQFKARVALEAIRGVKTVQQIASENQVHPVQVTQWKGRMLESASGVFEGAKKGVEGQREEEKARLERKVGQLAVEVDWLKKKCKELGIDP